MKILMPFVLIMLIILVCSCSATDPVSLIQDIPDSEPAAGQSEIIGSGQIVLDENGSLEIVNNRNIEFHYNVTWLLATSCPGGCFKYRILDITGEIWTIELTIENPTSLLVNDVRILYHDTHGKEIINQDGYIDLFGYVFCPFTAFAKEYTQRAFPIGPGGIDTEILELGWPAGQPPFVDYLVEVSLGGNCDEPWKIEGQVMDEIPTGGGIASVTAWVCDWQNDSNECWCDSTSIGGTDEMMIMTSEGNGVRGYDLDINVPPGQTPGIYPVILATRPVKPTVYNVIYATVSEEAKIINLTNDDVENLLNFTSKTIGECSGRISVVWSEDITQDDYPEIILKEFDGVWLDKFMVSNETMSLNTWANPSIAINMNNGDCHVMWEGYTSMNMALQYRMRAGVSWGDIQTMHNGAFCMDSQIDVENNGEVHIVFQDSDGPFMGLYYFHDPGTGIFDPILALAFPASPMDVYYAPSIAHDNNGYVHIPITTGFGGANNLGYKLWNGSSWSGFQWIIQDNASMWQDIAVAPNRKATMVYRKDDDNLWMKQWTGTWEPGQTQVTSSADIYGIPNMDSDSLGNIHMAYTGEADGDRDIYYTVYDELAQTWSSPENISDNASESIRPALIVGEDDSVHLVWQDDEDGDEDVYYIKL